jgi:hypothetical protein
MVGLAAVIGKTVEAEGLGTKVGLMSSPPASHCMEARDWTRLHDALRAGGERINRVHLPCYTERCGKEYYYDFNRVSMIVRGFLSDDVTVYPELENSAFSTFAKDGRFLGFQLESALPLVISGMTYDIYDFTANGPVEAFGYGGEIKRRRPYMQAVMDLKLKFSSLKGIVVPIDEKACYAREIKSSWSDLYPDEFNAAGFLSASGINYRTSREKRFFGESVALFGGAADNFSSGELEKLFRDNFVLLDGGAALKLFKRGLGRLANITDARRLAPDTGRQSYEQAAEGEVINGLRDYRASAQAKCGDYADLRYGGGVKLYSALYDHNRGYVGAGIAEGGNFAVFPYVCDALLYEQYNDLRRLLIYKILGARGGATVFTGRGGVSPYLYEDAEKYVLILVNSTVNSFGKIAFTAKNIAFKSAFRIGADGAVLPASLSADNGTFVIKEKFDYLSTQTLILRK